MCFFSHVNLATSSCPGASECTPTWNMASRTWAASHGSSGAVSKKMHAWYSVQGQKSLLHVCWWASTCLICVIYDTISLCLPNPTNISSNSQSEASLRCIVDRGSTASSRPSRNLSHGADRRVDCSNGTTRLVWAVKSHRLQNTLKILKMDRSW